MADYKSKYTGAQIDAGIDNALKMLTSEVVVDNLADASVGWINGYGQLAGPINLETLELPLDTAGLKTTLHYTYGKLIRMEPNTTYAFSEGYTIGSTIFNGTNGGRSGFVNNAQLTSGDGCLLYTTGGTITGYYFALSIHRGDNEDLSAFKLVKGSDLTTGETVLYLDESIRVKATQVEGLEEIIPENNGGTGSAEDASGLFDTLQPTARKIQNYQSPTTLTMSFMSDTHYQDGKANSAKELATARNMGTLNNFCAVDLIGNLGDMVPGDVPEEETRGYIAKLTVATIQNAKCPVVFSRGNHDDNGWYSGAGAGTYQPDEIISDKEWYQAVWGINAKHFVNDPNRPYGAYGYYDHEPSKIRVFVLNSEDIPYVLKDDGSYRYSSYNGHSFSDEQINFVANALYFSDKENPNEWAALFLSHVPLDTTNDDGYRFGIKDALIRGHEVMLAVIAAYRKGTAFSIHGSTYNPSLGDVQEDFMIDVSVDYSTKGMGDVIAFISGHTHTDNFSRSVGFENSLSRGYAYIGLMGSTQFANFIVDRENSRIASVKHGESIPDTTAGAAVNAPDTGSIAEGEWTVNIDQFRPNGENLYNGLSQIHYGGGCTFDSIGTLDMDTMEMTSVTADSKYAMSKGVSVKPFTKYAIPAAFNGGVLAFGSAGTRSGYITPTTGNGYKIITTGIRQYNLCFAFHKGSYTDYPNFKIKEIYSGMEF